MRYLNIVFSLLLPVWLSAQGGFRARYQLPSSLIGQSKAIYETSPGSYLGAGIVVDTLNGYMFNRLVTLGLDSSGQPQWTKKFGSRAFEYLDNLFSPRSFYRHNNFYYHTCSVKDSTNQVIGVLIKFNASGDTLWQKIYRDSTRDVIPQMLTASTDGGFLLTGFFQDWVNHTSTCLVIKTDANGTELWRKAIHKTTPDTQEGKAILQDQVSKKIIILGYQYIGNSSSWRTYDNILILDSLGNLLSRQYYNVGYLYDILQTQDKKIIGIGCTEAYNPATNSYYSYSYMMQFNLNNPAQPTWKNTFYDQYSHSNMFSCITELTNGDILIGGSIDSLKSTDTTRNTHLRLIKIDPANGKVLWRKDYEYQMNNKAFTNDLLITALEPTQDGGWVTAVRTWNDLTKPLFFVKYDSTGCDTSEAWCRSVALGIHERNKPEQRLEMFPNPSQDQVHVIWNAPVGESVLLRIADITGKIIYEVNIISQQELLLNVSGYAPGIYSVILLSTQSPAEIRKLIVR